MQLRDDLALATAIGTLRDIVAPALAADDAHAAEQLQVVIGLLSLMAARRGELWRFDVDELTRLVPFCRGLAALAPEHSGEALTWLTATGEDVLARAQAGPDEVLRAIRALRAASGALITAVYQEGDDGRRAALAQLVLEHADAQLLRERAWLAPQGWETRPAALPDLDALLK